MKRTLRVMHISALAAAVVLPGAMLGRLVLREFHRPAELIVEFAPAAERANSLQDEIRIAVAGDAISTTPLEPMLERLEMAVTAQGAAWDAPALVALSKGALTKSGPPALVEVPRAERWQVYFAEGITATEYARQLDSLGIELGAVGATGEIEYAAQLAKPMPDRRIGPAAAETRLYMSWRRGDLAEADRRLLASSGINVGEKVVVLFLPAVAEEKLAELEKKFAGREPSAILRTRFGVRAIGQGHVFYVIDQSPLK